MKPSFNSKLRLTFKLTHVIFTAAVVFALSCSFGKTNQNDPDKYLFVVKAEADGTISKVLVSEGASIGKGAEIVEIELQDQIQTGPVEEPTTGDPGTGLKAVEARVKNAEKEVTRTSIEVERVQSLVASNSAPPAQLDAARADFQKAQEDLESLKELDKDRKVKRLLERSENTKTPEPIKRERIITSRSTSAGIVKVLNASVGQKVKKGQPLATVSAN